MWEHIGPIITVVIFVLNLALAGAAAWIVLTVRDAIREARKEIDAQIATVGIEIDALKDKIDDKTDRQARDFGETVQALREKIVQLELYCRDTFVRRDGFYKVKDELSADIKDQSRAIVALGEKIEARLERMEGKIDNNGKR